MVVSLDNLRQWEAVCQIGIILEQIGSRLVSCHNLSNSYNRFIAANSGSLIILKGFIMSGGSKASVSGSINERNTKKIIHNAMGMAGLQYDFIKCPKVSGRLKEKVREQKESEIIREYVEIKPSYPMVYGQAPFRNACSGGICYIDWRIIVPSLLNIVIEDKNMEVLGSVFEKIETFILRAKDGMFNADDCIVHYSGNAFSTDNYSRKINHIVNTYLKNDTNIHIFNTSELIDFLNLKLNKKESL